MVSEQVGYEGNCQRRGEEVALDQAEVHDKEDKCKIQAFTRATILRMTGKKILDNTNQNANKKRENMACAQGGNYFYRSWKGHWRCPRFGTCFAQHLPVRIFARGATQGSGKMTADAQVIPRNKL